MAKSSGYRMNCEAIYAISRCCVEVFGCGICFLWVFMNRFEYIVESIDGDYAHLRRTDIESDELKLVARALLPPEIMEGTKLLYEWMQYSIME